MWVRKRHYPISCINMFMSRQLVFIDESGDAGLTGSKSSHFIIASVIITNENENDLIRAKIIEYKRTPGWHDRDEFKFSRTRKEVLKELLKLLQPYDYKVYGVVLDKSKRQNISEISDRYSLYNYVLVELLKILTTVSGAKVYIDGDVGKKYKKNTLTFLRKHLGDQYVRIMSLKFVDSKTNEELQLADVVVGSINRSYSDHKDKKDYIRLIKDKIVEIREL